MPCIYKQIDQHVLPHLLAQQLWCSRAWLAGLGSTGAFPAKNLVHEFWDVPDDFDMVL